ncbi:MAG: hypothetical protein EXR07_04690 [Acetobacteraceae bacterium]|nr:hypothetical protein [Acetobacteraceae bacterium]
MRLTLISATSIFALFAASVGLTHAAALNTAVSQTNIFDLVQDGDLSPDGDGRMSAIAATALETMLGGWRRASFTGPVDQPALLGRAFPATPLGAARGVKLDEDVVTTVVGLGMAADAMQKMAALGQARIAPLIGTVGNGLGPNEKPGRTVFVAAGGLAGFNDGGNVATVGKGPSIAYAFAPSSTSTATITVAGAGNLSRQGIGNAPYVAAFNGLQGIAPANQQSPQPATLSAMAEPALGYRYASPPNPGSRTSSVAASFSSVATASGTFARDTPPGASQVTDLVPQMPDNKIQSTQAQFSNGQPSLAQRGQVQPDLSLVMRTQADRFQTVDTRDGPAPVPGSSSQVPSDKIRTTQGQSGTAQPSLAKRGQVRPDLPLATQTRDNQFQTVDTKADYTKPVDLIQMVDAPDRDTQADGMLSQITASVSANPAATTARSLANSVSASTTMPAGRSAEAFHIGTTPGPRTPGATMATVSAPLQGKIVASAGALNDILALP